MFVNLLQHRLGIAWEEVRRRKVIPTVADAAHLGSAFQAQIRGIQVMKLSILADPARSLGAVRMVNCAVFIYPARNL